MQPIRIDHAPDSRLRFVFDDAVHAVGLAANATFGDIARAMGDMASKRRGIPVAIDVTFALTPAPYRSPPIGAAAVRLPN